MSVGSKTWLNQWFLGMLYSKAGSNLFNVLPQQLELSKYHAHIIVHCSLNFPGFFSELSIGQAIGKFGPVHCSVGVYNLLLFLSANIGNITSQQYSFPVTLVEATTDTVLLVLKVLILAKNA